MINANGDKHQVLLGSAGVGAAYASAKALRKNYDVKIISSDTNPSYLITTNLLSDYFEQVPAHISEDFNSRLIGIIEKYNIDTYIPFIDQEVHNAALLIENNKISNDIFLQAKKSNITEICLDKFNSYKWLKLNGFNTPETYLIENKDELTDGYIIKPRIGFGSVIQKISNEKNLKIENYNQFVMQKFCDKPEITIDVHYSRKFNFFEYACRERIETKSGVCTKARIFQEPILKEIALSLAQKMDLSSFCFQVMNMNNEFAITDINPRLGAGTALSVAVGLDFFSGMFATLWDEDPQKYFNKLGKEKYVTRQYCEFIM